MVKSVLLPALGMALLLPAGAIARDHNGNAQPSDPNKVVCRSDDATGSRLAKTKQCMTLAQWAEQKRVNQQEIERIQANRYKNN